MQIGNLWSLQLPYDFCCRLDWQAQAIWEAAYGIWQTILISQTLEQVTWRSICASHDLPVSHRPACPTIVASVVQGCIIAQKQCSSWNILLNPIMLSQQLLIASTFKKDLTLNGQPVICTLCYLGSTKFPANKTLSSDNPHKYSMYRLPLDVWRDACRHAATEYSTTHDLSFNGSAHRIESKR